jgi:hypothetical protein
MARNKNQKMENRERHAWDIACQTAVVTKEDALQVYYRLMQKFEEMDPIQTDVESKTPK